MRDNEFDQRNSAMVEAMAADSALARTSTDWLRASFSYEYSYHFEWLGVPIIQYPQDIVAMQDIIWRTRPSVVVEAGIARGGSLVLYASLLALLGGVRRVIGIDIDIRPHNRAVLEAHPLADLITLIEGSSVDPATVAEVGRAIGVSSPVMVILDSNHAHAHVLRELELYSQLVTPGCYLVVFDTLVEELEAHQTEGRPWGPGNSPLSAVQEFMATAAEEFEVDETVSDRLLITAARNGYLRRRFR